MDGVFQMVEDNNDSLLAAVGHTVAFIFAPLGFGTWQATVATVTGLIAKEEVVSTFGVLFPGNLTMDMAAAFTPIAAYSFMIFNLLCAPCFAAMGPSSPTRRCSTAWYTTMRCSTSGCGRKPS